MNNLFVKSNSENLVDIKMLLLSLLIATLLGLVVALVHRFIKKRSGVELNFTQSLISLAPIITLVMMFIGNNLALSLGMVGSLSLIRFRTAVKEITDLVFILWIMAIGIGCGTLNWQSSAIATLLISLIVVMISFLKLSNPDLKGTLLIQVSKKEELDDYDLGLKPMQVVYLPQSVEALYQIKLSQFEKIQGALKNSPGTWRFIAGKE